MMAGLGLAVLGFFSGSILFSSLLPMLLKGIDITACSEDHNPGASNAFAFAGKDIGFLALFCDLSKGALPVLLARQILSLNDPMMALVIAAPVLGHAFSPFAHGHGGKAIAASFGVFLGLFPESTLLLPLIFWYLLFSFVFALRPHAWRTVIVFSFLLIAAALQPYAPLFWGTLLLSSTVIYRHLPGLRSSAPEIWCFGHKLWAFRPHCEQHLQD